MNGLPSRRVRGTLLAALLVSPAAAVPGLAQSHLTIYGDGRVLVRQTLAVPVPRGSSRQRVELEQFDPGSLVALDPGVSISAMEYPREVDPQTLYRAMVGRRLLFQKEGSPDTVSALILGAEPVRFELANGQVSLAEPGTPLFPRELLGARRPTVLVIESERPLSRLDLGYLTDGVRWYAEYSVMLGTPTAEVSGRVVLHSTRLRADSADISVLEGQVARVSEQERDYSARRSLGFAAAAARVQLEEVTVTGAGAEAVPPVPIGLGGFRVYHLPGHHTLAPGHTTVARIFPPIAVAVERVHTVAGAGRMQGQGQGEQTLPVEIRYRLTRPRESAFGAQAIPPGLARLYARAPDGSVLLVGEASVTAADPGKTLELAAGNAVSLTARSLPAKRSTVQDTVIGVDGRREIVSSGQVSDMEIRFVNASDTAAVVEMTDRLEAQSRVVSSSVPPESAGPGQVRFRVRVPARGEATLRYRLRLTP
jgi:hypothetical protein